VSGNTASGGLGGTGTPSPGSDGADGEGLGAALFSLGGTVVVDGVPQTPDTDTDGDENLDSVVLEGPLAGTGPLARVTGHVFEDTDGDGAQDPGEPDLAGVDVVIEDSLGGSQTVTTDGGGDYVADVPPGATTLDVDEDSLPAGSVQTAGMDPTVLDVTVCGGAADVDGFQPQGTVSGRVFEDVDGDGVEDPGEPGLAGIDVVVTDSLGGMQTLTTDGLGDYSTVVPAGATTVDVDEATLPAGAAQTAGTDPTVLVVPAGGEVSDLDGYQPLQALEIPTLGDAALALLALVLAALGAIGLSRRGVL